MWAWGANSDGQLGDNTTTDSPTPVQVSGLGGITTVTAGQDHSLALTGTGTVWAWGDGADGQLGNSATANALVPVQVSGLTGVTSIAAGGSHSVAVESGGSVWVWGANGSQQLGNATGAASSVPVEVSGIGGVTTVAAGDNHTVALTSAGSYASWGDNSDGQLGDTTTTPGSGAPDNSAGGYDYSWLGAHQIGTEQATGPATLQMGARTYVPGLGRFLQTDPQPGGSANNYEYCNQDPINCTDLNGRWTISIHHTFTLTHAQAERYANDGRLTSFIWELAGAFATVIPGADVAGAVMDALDPYIETIEDMLTTAAETGMDFHLSVDVQIHAHHFWNVPEIQDFLIVPYLSRPKGQVG